METQVRTLADFLLARIADTQAVGLELSSHRNFKTSVAAKQARTRLIQTEAAHRRIIQAARGYSPELAEGDNGEWAFDEVLRILAAAYADHPDYRESWRLE